MTITINGSGTVTGVTTLATTNVSQTLTTPIVTTTIGVGNATPSASGSGITFPATQSASSDANTLDDYEEGTWTPVLTPTAGTITSQSCFGSYIKIGKQVTLTFKAVITGGTVTTISNIGGFPFTSSNDNQQACGAARETQVTGTMWEILMMTNSTVADVRRYDNSSTVTNSYGWQGSVTYFSA